MQSCTTHQILVVTSGAILFSCFISVVTKEVMFIFVAFAIGFFLGIYLYLKFFVSKLLWRLAGGSLWMFLPFLGIFASFVIFPQNLYKILTGQCKKHE